MQIDISRIGDGIYHLEFPTQYGITSTCLRIQEFYESDLPGFRGKYFTLEEYMDAYAKWSGNFTYFSDWSGFNFTDKVVDSFSKVFRRSCLLEKEKHLLDVLASIPDDQYAIVGTIKGHTKTLKHEISHAMYYLDGTYRRRANALLKAREDSEELLETLHKMGYGKNVLKDELQAYLATDTKPELKKHFGEAPERDAHKALYKEFYSKYVD
jgi:hypothetical protein